MTYRPTRLLVDLSALESNFKKIKETIGPDRKVCTVVKANAYGMGAVAVARKLQDAGSDYFGVAMLEGARRLRTEGITKPIIVLGALSGIETFRVAAELNVDINIHHLAALRDLEALGPDTIGRMNIHLKLNTGMSRLGLHLEEVPEFCRQAERLGFKPKGIFTTFSSSDEKSNPRTPEQLSIFIKAIDILREHGMEPPLKHAANSGAILNFPETYQTMVRPGLLLWGIPSYAAASPEGFRPVACLESHIAQIADYPKGSRIGYSGSYTLTRDSRLAVLPIGYADGMNRLLSSKGSVLLRGKRAPILGKISMDLTIIDVTDIPEAILGDRAVIFGKGESGEISPWEIAEQIGSIPWEVFCWIGARVPRVYIE